MLDLIGNITLGTGFPPIRDVLKWNKLPPLERSHRAKDIEVNEKFGPYTHIHTGLHWDRFTPSLIAQIDGFAKEYLFDDRTIPPFSLHEAYINAYHKYADQTVNTLFTIPEYGEEMAARYAFYVFRQETLNEPLYPFLTPSVLEPLCETVKKAECTIEEVS